MGKKFIGNGLEINDLDKIAQILKKNGLSRIAVSNEEFTLEIEDKPAPPPHMAGSCPPPPPQMGMQGGFPMPAPPVGVPNEPTAQSPAETAPQMAGTAVKAPIVGTYYSAASPDSEPFVTVGARVNKGDVIFIIESMKVMSEVQSEVSGTVKELCVNNGDAVEFGQTVMIID